MILRSHWVLPITSDPIRDGFVEINNDTIAAFGPASEMPRQAADVIDLGDAILMPGLVNAHCHLNLTCFAGEIAPCTLWQWLPQLLQRLYAPDAIEKQRQAIVDGAWQSLQAGVTCVGDINRTPIGWDMFAELPIRSVCFAELLPLAAVPARTIDELREAVDSVPAGPLCTPAISPHAPYSVPTDILRKAIAVATKHNIPWCTHWAETREEVDYIQGDPSGLPPGFVHAHQEMRFPQPQSSVREYLHECTNGSSPGILAHMNYFTDGADIDWLAGSGHTVAYCPRAHAYFGHEDHPFLKFVTAGVPVAIATDSLAANKSLALLDELQFIRRRYADAPSPAQLLEMVTITPATALHLGDKVGSIEVGKQADLAAFPFTSNNDSLVPPLDGLIDSSPAPEAVWVGGNRAI